MRTIAMAALLALASCSAAPDDESNTAATAEAAPHTPDALDNQIAEVAAAGEAETNAALARKKTPGDECLSIWDGSASELVDQVKDQLRDPSSFEHVETKMGDVTSTGMRPITMKYRAKNGFSGLNVEEVPAALDPRDCSVTLITSKRQMLKVLGD